MDQSSRALLSENAQRSELEGHLPFAADSELSDIACDKIKFHQWCERLDISYPRSLTTHHSNDIFTLSDQFSYPFVLKGSRGSGGKQVDIIQSQSHLERVVAHTKNRHGWVLQEFIDGTVGTTTFVASSSKLHACFSHANRVCTGGGIGPAAISQFVDAPELTAIANKMVVQGGISGFTGFDWMLTESGDYKVIDPHFGRVPPTAAISHLHQIELGKAYTTSLQNGSTPSTNTAVKNRTVWIFPQATLLLFDRAIWAGFLRYHPFFNNVSVFLCGRGEWRLFLAQNRQYVAGSLKVALGKWRKKLKHMLKRASRLKN